MSRALRWLVERFPKRVIYDRDGVTPYLTRYYLLGGPRWPREDKSGDPDAATWSRWPISVHVHRFHRSDDAGELHNHPWRWSLSFILAGGYSEERRETKFTQGGVEHRVVIRRAVRPGSVNFIRGDDFHRVDLFEREAWSLFIAGPKVQSWGFWDRDTEAFTPWREFIAQRRGA